MDVTFASTDNTLMQANEPHTPLFDPKPLIASGRKWSRWLGPAISFAVLIAIGFELMQLKRADLRALVPVTPLFWMVFFTSYFVGPVTDWLIFRRLWTIPVSGILALVRKQVTNALLPSYSGEVYFYAWARRRAEITGAPFGAIKDVAILSALMGNFVTLVMLVLVYTLFGNLLHEAHFGSELRIFSASIGFVTFSSLIAMIFRSRLFSLPQVDLWVVSAIVMVRIFATTFLLALMWHLIMPQIELGWWVVVSTIKLLLSRLPFVPNQEGLFASVAILLIGNDQPLTQLVAMVAIATLITHIIIGALLGLADLIRTGERVHG